MTIFIKQFMWGFQHIFRRGIEFEVNRILSQIGLQTNNKIKVLLIGFATENNLAHQICVEPESGPFVIEDLLSIKERTVELSESDLEYNMFHTHPRVHESRKRGLLLRSRAHAIAEAIETSEKFGGLSFFVSNSAPIAGYEVHTCIGIPSDALESVPRFNNPIKDDYHGQHIEESFVHAVINNCLYRADKALYLPDPGERLEVLGDGEDIIRSSAQQFVQGITYALASMPNDLFGSANRFSSLTYERSGAKGHLAVTQQDNLSNKLKVRFQNPISLGNARSMRKLLEITDESTTLLADYISVHGLGECSPAPDVSEITVEGHAKWSISIDNTILMRVNYGHATLPSQILDKDFFIDISERTIGGAEVERIWNTVQFALKEDHGTTIVVSSDPVSEIKRLGQEALAIRPEYLDYEDIARLGRVDGAIMLGADGRCYAFGVILDGLATSSGDRSRGARFNSSVRYQQTTGVRTMVIVISDDGTVDIVPNLMPRVWRSEVEESVQAFCEYSELVDNDGEEWARMYQKVKSLNFYLNEDQCSSVNESHDKEMARRLESGGFATHESLHPNPDMNDSYFWDNGNTA